MENYAALIMIVAIACCFLDLFTDRWPAMQRQLFPIVTFILYSLCVIAYYYGPDIWTYVPFYEKAPDPITSWHQANEDSRFEIGYSLFCSVFHSLGISYWWMTWIIKSLYFGALWLLFRNLPKRQIFALSCVVMTDINLIMHETRQCLAVSFFIFMVLLLQNRKYIWTIVCAILAVSMHKSGFMPIGMTIIGIFIYQTRQYSAIYTLLILGMLAMIALPVQRISTSILSLLPFPESYIESITHHLLLGRQFQMIAFIYLALLMAFNLYVSYDKMSRYTWIALTVLAGMVIIVLLYPYYFLLTRMRSYFVPFIIYYLILLLSDTQRTQTVPYGAMMKQALMLFVMAYYIHFAISLERGARGLHYPVYRASTIFELRNSSPGYIRDRQLKTAYNYWTQDYMKKENNKL